MAKYPDLKSYLQANYLNVLKGVIQEFVDKSYDGSGFHSINVLSLCKHEIENPVVKALTCHAGLTREENQTRLRENNGQDFQNQGIKCGQSSVQRRGRSTRMKRPCEHPLWLVLEKRGELSPPFRTGTYSSRI